MNRVKSFLTYLHISSKDSTSCTLVGMCFEMQSLEIDLFFETKKKTFICDKLNGQ